MAIRRDADIIDIGHPIGTGTPEMSSNGVEGSNNNVSTNASPLTSSEKRVTIITETHPPSPSTTNVEQASLAESLIRGNQELRANVASNFIKKGLIGMGLGLATGIFIFKSTTINIIAFSF